MGETKTGRRRSLKYIRLAAHLAALGDDVREFEMSVQEIEDMVGERLPSNARFPSWWRNDERRMHSRAWLTAGWEVGEMDSSKAMVRFIRLPG